MTREEAICELSVIWERLSHPEDCENGCYSFRDGNYLEAIDMAIEALQTDLVRCKDCKHWHSNTEFCDIWSYPNVAQRTLNNDYCSLGKRREGSEVEE